MGFIILLYIINALKETSPFQRTVLIPRFMKLKAHEVSFLGSSPHLDFSHLASWFHFHLIQPVLWR